MIGDKVLPIGSVVRVKGIDTASLMIIGTFGQTVDGKQKDYIATNVPVGVVNPNEVLLFNAEDIEEVIAEGYRSEYFGNFELLVKAIEQAHQQKNDQAE